MLKEKIHQQFDKYSDLHLLFHFDPEGLYETEIDNLNLVGIKVVKYEKDEFNLKVKLNGEWLNEKVFLYLKQNSPREQKDYQEFALLDLLVANRELMLDNVADFMEEYHLQRNQRSLVSRYMKELQYISNRKLLEPILSADKLEENVLIRGLFSSFVRFTEIEQWTTIIVRILTLVSDDKKEDFNRFKKKVLSNNLQEVLQNQLSNFFGPVELKLDQEELQGLLLKFKYNAIIQQLGKPHNDDPYAELKINESRILSSLNALLETGLNNEKVKEEFQVVFVDHTKAVDENQIIEVYGPDADYAYLPEKLLWALLKYYANNVGIQPEQTLKGLERIGLKSMTSSYFKPVLGFYTYLADMLMQLNENKSYILDKPVDYIKKYTQEYYHIDQSYRKAVLSYHNIDTTELPKGLNHENSKALLEHHYEDFIQVLNQEWLKCMNESQFNYTEIPALKQYNFFTDEISHVDQKVAVVISDALRYEVAESLLNELHADSKNKAEIRYMLASIPSKTSIGMANLLPGKDRKFSKNDIKIENISSTGTENRAKILQMAEESSATTTLTNIKANSEAENRKLFKHKVVYIYHDIIDSIGDKKSSERRTFEAVEDAINEIKGEVKKLHSSFAVALVIVTADHGFIYNDKAIQEKDKEDPSDTDTIISHNRFEILPKRIDTAYGCCFPLSNTTPFNEDFYVKIPASTNRYKKQGVGHQFVHGGGSLQEVIVPLIESTRKREKLTNKVNPVLVNTTLKIVSNVLRIQILQEKKISRFEKERDITVGIFKGNQLVSNSFEATLNSTSELPTDRSFRFNLSLLGSTGQENVLKLKVFDKTDMLNPLIEENVINQTLIESDF